MSEGHVMVEGIRQRAIDSLEEREVFAVYRRRTGVRQTHLAAECGIRQPLISQWERGRREFSPAQVDSLWRAMEHLVGNVAA